MLKLALPAGAIAGLFGPQLTETMQEVVLSAAAFAAVGYLWTHFIRPASELLRGAARTQQQMPSLMSQLHAIEERCEGLENKLAALTRASGVQVRRDT